MFTAWEIPSNYAGDSPRLRGSLTRNGTALKQEGGHDEDAPRVIPMSDGQNGRNVGDQTGVPEPHEGERNEGADDEDEDQKPKKE